MVALVNNRHVIFKYVNSGNVDLDDVKGRDL